MNEYLLRDVQYVLGFLNLEQARVAGTESAEVVRVSGGKRSLPGCDRSTLDACYWNLYSAVDVANGVDGLTFRRYEAFCREQARDWYCPRCHTWRIGPYLQRTNSFAHEREYCELAPPQIFAIRQVGIVFDPSGSGSGSGMREFASRYGFQLWLGHRSHFSSPIASSFRFQPEEGSFTTLMGPIKGLAELEGLPLVLPSQLPYHVELEGEPFPVPTPFRLWATLCGIMFRGVQ